MSKYASDKLSTFIKIDSKKVKKQSNKNPDLSIVQNELAKVFGYRHFHELNKVWNNIEKYPEIKSITSESIEKYNKLKDSYERAILNYVPDFDFTNYLFSKIKSLELYTSKNISFENVEVKRYDLASGNYYFNLSLKDLKALVYPTLNTESIAVKAYLKVVFELLKIESNDLFKDYFEYIEGFNLEKNIERINDDNINELYKYFLDSTKNDKVFGDHINAVMSVKKYAYIRSHIIGKKNILFTKSDHKEAINISEVSLNTKQSLPINFITQNRIKYEFEYFPDNKIMNRLIEYIDDIRSVNYDSNHSNEHSIVYSSTRSGMSYNYLQKGKKIIIVSDVLPPENPLEKYINGDDYGMFIQKAETAYDTLRKVSRMQPDVVYVDENYVGKDYFENEDLKWMYSVGIEINIV